ncbi:MAG TPA: hypothetical protein VIX35_00085, partial [Vicinamibacterales bacterium]
CLVPYLALLPLVLRLSIHAAALELPAPNSAWIRVTFVPGEAALAAEASSSWRADFGPPDHLASFQGSAPAVAVEYSHGYHVRLRIHRDASFAMLPLFAAEAVVGEKLFKNPNSQGLKTTHGWLNAGILGLFGLDTVTGVWNLKEGWHNPEGRARRLIHSLLMLTADVGFVATDRLAPSRRAVAAGNTSGAVTHRDVAIVSISVASLGYAIMIFR